MSAAAPQPPVGPPRLLLAVLGAELVIAIAVTTQHVAWQWHSDARLVAPT